MKKRIAVLGSTGSIGRNACRILSEYPERFEVIALAARDNIELLAEQAAGLKAKIAISTDDRKAAELQRLLPAQISAQTGQQAMIELAAHPEVDLVLCAVVGTAGLLPVLAALKQGKAVALASKEVLVMAGELVRRTAGENGGILIPVDSEHSALFQCLQGRRSDEVASLILTASGGAFRDLPPAELIKVNCSHALSHPTWNMGPKVTIDSASLMNKALELLEAHFLFGLPAEKLQVLIHPQSIVHSLLELTDGSMLAQLSVPDMRFAIQYALSYPERLAGNLPKLSFAAGLKLDFAEPDRAKYPSLDFAYEAMRHGGTMPAVLNAANEVAVDQFRAGRITFPAIWCIIEKTMAAHAVQPADTLDGILAADQWAREFAGQVNLSREKCCSTA